MRLRAPLPGWSAKADVVVIGSGDLTTYRYYLSQSHLLTLVLPSGLKVESQPRSVQEIHPTSTRKILWWLVQDYVIYQP
jgi:hypothetical protein